MAVVSSRHPELVLEPQDGCTAGPTVHPAANANRKERQPKVRLDFTTRRLSVGFALFDQAAAGLVGVGRR